MPGLKKVAGEVIKDQKGFRFYFKPEKGVRHSGVHVNIVTSNKAYGTPIGIPDGKEFAHNSGYPLHLPRKV